MTQPLDDHALDTLFRTARTYSRFLDKPVPDDLLRRVWDLARMGPTSANCQPARVVFIKSAEAKARLKPSLSAGNLEKTMLAPVTALIGYDTAFYDKLPKLFPHVDARAWFAGNPPLIEATAFRNGSLQGAYLILAARALGLDCGAMSGFDNAKADAAFFEGTPVKSNFLCNIGFGDRSAVHARNPRLEFDEACRVV